VTFLANTTVMVGGGRACARASWAAIAALVCVTAIEIALIWLLMAQRKRPASQPKETPGAHITGTAMAANGKAVYQTKPE